MWVSLGHASVPCAHVVLLPTSDFIQMSFLLLLLLLNYAAINNLKVGLLLCTATRCRTRAAFSLQWWLRSSPLYRSSVKWCILENKMISTLFLILNWHPKVSVLVIVTLSGPYCYDKVTKSKAFTGGLTGWWGQVCKVNVLILLSWGKSINRNEHCLQLSWFAVCTTGFNFTQCGVQRSSAWSSAQAENVLKLFFLNISFDDCKRLLLSLYCKFQGMSGGMLPLSKRD